MIDNLYKIRWKPLWTCTKCGEKIYFQDVAFNLVVSSRRLENTPIKCLRCLHTDPPGEVRTYGGKDGE